MWPIKVVPRLEFSVDQIEMPLRDNHKSIETFNLMRLDDPFQVRRRFGDCGVFLTTSASIDLNTSSNATMYLASLSRSTYLGGNSMSPACIRKFRAFWHDQAKSG